MTGFGLLTAMLGSVLSMPAQTALADPAQCVAVFDFELIDMSLEGEIKGTNSAEQQRLGLLSEQLRKWLAADRRHELCDMSPISAEAKAANLYACGCIQRLASSVDAGLAITGVVNKISNLILSITIHVRDVRTNRRIVVVTADIRSNTDRSWTRGLDWLIKHRLAGALAAPGAGEP
ncbi:MAG: DUF3280 domain-containing protein [Hyphomicrobiales bacterium]